MFDSGRGKAYFFFSYDALHREVRSRRQREVMTDGRRNRSQSGSITGAEILAYEMTRMLLMTVLLVIDLVANRPPPTEFARAGALSGS